LVAAQGGHCSHFLRRGLLAGPVKFGGPVGRVSLLWPTLVDIGFRLAKVVASRPWRDRLLCSNHEWGL